MEKKTEQKHKESKKFRKWMYIAAVALNVLAFLCIGFVYFMYAETNTDKLRNENLNNISNINAAYASTAETSVKSMENKIDDVVSFIKNENLNYDEIIKYFGDANANVDRTLQLVLTASEDENGVPDYGDYSGISVRKTVNGDALETVTKEIEYEYNYSDLLKSLRDIEDVGMDGACIAPVFTDADTKVKSFAVYRHIVLQDENGKDKYYTVLLVMDSRKLLNTYRFQNEYEGQQAILIKSNGDYIIKNDGFKGGNFFDYLASYNSLTLDEKNEIAEDVRQTLNGESTSMNLFYKNYCYEDCAFCISAMANDWYSITSVPLASFSAAESDTNYSLIILILFIMLFCFDSIIIYFVWRTMQYNVLVAEEATEEANNANTAKSRFLSTMSHELRTPLNAIIGLVALSRDNINNVSVLEDYLRKVDTSSKLLLQLISDILDVSAIESNKMKINYGEFELTKLVSSLSSIYFDQCSARNIDFNVELENIHTETLIGDQIRLNQVLLNFLSNAVKFTPEGGKVTLKVTQKEQTETTTVIRFDVIDTGCGINDELRQRLFKPFEQASGVASRKLGGTGLGLSIAKNLTELMNGTIEMESKEGEGSRFSAQLPFEIPEEKVKRNFSPIEGMKILVVISDTSAKTYIGQVLDNFGIEHTLAASGNDALTALRNCGRSNLFTLCMIDKKLSDMQAPELVKAIRSEESGKDLRVMVLAYDPASAKQMCKDVGVDDYLEKPVFPSSLYNALGAINTGGVAASPDIEQKYDLSGKRVLLVEDNLLNTEIAGLLLGKIGLEVESAEDGQIGCDKFNASPDGYFDAILMDVQMPVMNGYDATMAIRAGNHPQAKSIPIIAMTADAFSEDVKKGVSAGMNAHLSKPIEPDLLYSTLKKYLRR